MSDLQLLLDCDAALAKVELHRHLSEIWMTPAENSREWHYVAEGTWDILGTGPNAPVIELTHSDGYGGLQSPEPASLVLPFSFELVEVAA
jgi:hypothetical protein